ncbi:hypothetical protein Nepgr_030336 [Nepenthes gracilis]|uniref:Epidermal patterning factor-like protein n=1 Tax=Nepenthes gracilis TaxID=150966 RepID=A0AAD3TGA7_NEPGR|nr:hypothetical protein Nepgr_030336 [Nepenthes gracilis]
MGGLRRRRYIQRISVAAALLLGVLASVAAITANPTRQRQLSESGNRTRPNSGPTQSGRSSIWAMSVSRRTSSKRTLFDAVVTRRRLVAPGSSPPTCRSKCGTCNPCTAVHVPIPLGVSMGSGYYPEAWRCNCGNKLYIP